MHTAIQAIFDEHANPKRCCTNDVKREHGPTLQVAARMQAQIVEYRMLLLAAEAAEDLPDDFRGKLEMFDQTLRRAESVSAEVVDRGRELGRVMAQLDRYMKEAESSLKEWYARKEPTTDPTGAK